MVLAVERLLVFALQAMLSSSPVPVADLQPASQHIGQSHLGHPSEAEEQNIVARADKRPMYMCLCWYIVHTLH